MLANGVYRAVVESVWPKDTAYGESWQWNFRIAGERYPLRAFTSASLKNQKTRAFVEAVLHRSVDPTEELYPSYFEGESCTVAVGTILKNGREFNTIESVM